jgi:hypothetical protein
VALHTFMATSVHIPPPQPTSTTVMRRPLADAMLASIVAWRTARPRPELRGVAESS